MPQPPRYERDKDFTLDFGNETDHSALNAEFDSAANSINDIRTNLAILQADDGKLRPSVVTPDSISPELRVSLVEGVIVDAQDMLNQSLAASAAAETAKTAAETAAASALSSATTASTAATTATGAASTATSAATSANADKTAAAASQTAAASSASNAQASATSAQSSATAASSAASTSSTKAGDAATSASTATTKAAEASSSAATATTKASEAAMSASQAAASAASINPANLIHTTGNETKAGVLTLTDGLVTSSVNGGQIAGFRNKIINGCCRVSQRGTVPVVNGMATYGGCDRIYVQPIGWTSASGNITLSGGEGATTFANSQGLQYFTSTGSGEIHFGTRLEARDVRGLNGKTVTFSVIVMHGAGANASASIGMYKANALDNFGALTFIGESSTTSVQDLTWTRLKFTVTLGVTDANNGLVVYARFSGLSAMTNKSFYVGDWQLEEGSMRTPFEQRPYGQELKLCQRYFQYLQGNSLRGQVGSVTSMHINCEFPVMRVAPTVTLSKTSYSSAAFEMVSGGIWQSAATASLTIASISSNTFSATFSGFSGLTVGAPVSANFVSNFVSLSAEL